ncbi:MAG: aminotransferase class V-fold PLP-dependent enzyme [Thermoanaerobaculaceae bacterium]|jgi:selenocysteine lyase/cysteine desulfurase|nr:aminotransferase class V-fold PLP-dependent enzyme [Thermoanaerobaculaceae bacterium]
MRSVHLNQAATSFPKPREVVEAVHAWFDRPPVDAARGGDGANDPVAPCRKELAGLLGVNDAAGIVLLPSATHALNLVIGALVEPGCHVVTSTLEHNSVLRPIAHRERDIGVAVTMIEPGADGTLEPASLQAALRPSTSLVALTHASNVTGSIQPVEELAEVAAAASVPLLLDASQTAGAVSLTHGRLPGRVFVAFAGHKGLMGPPGVGCLVVPDSMLPQTIVGGTGMRSEDRFHPPDLPLRHEAGTPNLPGIAGLRAGVRFVHRIGVEALGAHRAWLVERLREGMRVMGHIRLFPLAHEDGRVGIVPFCVAGWDPDEVGLVLRESFSIEVRTGLHCAPLALRGLPGEPRGSVRVSVGLGTAEDDVDLLLAALASLEGC